MYRQHRKNIDWLLSKRETESVIKISLGADMIFACLTCHLVTSGSGKMKSVGGENISCKEGILGTIRALSPHAIYRQYKQISSKQKKSPPLFQAMSCPLLPDSHKFQVARTVLYIFQTFILDSSLMTSWSIASQNGTQWLTSPALDQARGDLRARRQVSVYQPIRGLYIDQ